MYTLHSYREGFRGRKTIDNTSQGPPGEGGYETINRYMDTYLYIFIYLYTGCRSQEQDKAFHTSTKS